LKSTETLYSYLVSSSSKGFQQFRLVEEH